MPLCDCTFTEKRVLSWRQFFNTGDAKFGITTASRSVQAIMTTFSTVQAIVWYMISTTGTWNERDCLNNPNPVLIILFCPKALNKTHLIVSVIISHYIPSYLILSCRVTWAVIVVIAMAAFVWVTALNWRKWHDFPKSVNKEVHYNSSLPFPAVTVCNHNPIRWYFFQRKNKHVFTFYVIPPHRLDQGDWNVSSCKIKTYLFHTVDITGVDVLATQAQGAGASATMIFTMLNRVNSVPAGTLMVKSSSLDKMAAISQTTFSNTF